MGPNASPGNGCVRVAILRCLGDFCVILGELRVLRRQRLSRAIWAAGGAGAEAQKGLAGRLRAFLRGRSTRPDAIQLRGITPELVQEAAAATEGFSGRELAKLVASMQVQFPPLLHLLRH